MNREREKKEKENRKKRSGIIPLKREVQLPEWRKKIMRNFGENTHTQAHKRHWVLEMYLFVISSNTPPLLSST